MLIVNIFSIAAGLILFMIMYNFEDFQMPVAFILSFIAILFAGFAYQVKEGLFQKGSPSIISTILGLICVLILAGLCHPIAMDAWAENAHRWTRPFLVWMLLVFIFIIFELLHTVKKHRIDIAQKKAASQPEA